MDPLGCQRSSPAVFARDFDGRKRRIACRRSRYKAGVESGASMSSKRPTPTTGKPLAASFTAVLEQSAAPGGWCYVVWPESAAFFGTRGRVKVQATVDGVPMTTAFMALGDGRHKLPIKAAVRRAIGKQAGDSVKIELRSRVDGPP
jgi:hypothetical protein